MKIQFATAALSLALALPSAAFAQDQAVPGEAQAGTATTLQHEAPQHSAARGADTSGYGVQPTTTSDSSSSHAPSHYPSLSDWGQGRGGLYAHH